jgi:hypothetical protein
MPFPGETFLLRSKSPTASLRPIFHAINVRPPMFPNET